MSLLKINDLHVSFRTRKGEIEAVRGVSFALDKGKTLALVGESGSGKSVTAMSVLKLLDENGYISAGEVLFTDENGGSIDLAKLPKEKMYAIRGNRISMIFQEPMTALNPVLSIKRQLCEPFMIHQNMRKKQAVKEAEKMLEAVHIQNAKRVLKS